MENQITCPACKRTITNNPVVDSAAKGEDQVLGSEYVICECGERISYWAITAQLREQKKILQNSGIGFTASPKVNRLRGKLLAIAFVIYGFHSPQRC